MGYQKLARRLASLRQQPNRTLTELSTEEKAAIAERHKREHAFFGRSDRVCNCPVCLEAARDKEEG